MALLGDRAGNGEGFEAFADGGGAVGGVLQAALDGDGGAEGVSPDRVIKADGLHAADDLVTVDAFGKEHFVAGVQRFEAVGFQALVNFGHAALLRFKSSHG